MSLAENYSSTSFTGWGPSLTEETKFDGLLFNPFSKSDKYGRAADFIAKDYNKMVGKPNRAGDDDNVSNPGELFNLVDTAKTKTSNRSGLGFRGRWNKKRPILTRKNEPQVQPKGKGKALKYVAQKPVKSWRKDDKHGGDFRRNRNNEPSVKIHSEWEIVEQFEFNNLSKLSILKEPQVEDISVVGSLKYYNETFDQVTSRTAVKLEKESFPGGVFPHNTSSEDPSLIELARGFMETEKSSLQTAVFCTDELLAQIMVSTRSVYAWDVVFTKLENNIILVDKREESKLHQDTVNESAPPLAEEEEQGVASYNNILALSSEASSINETFRQQVIKADSKPKVFSKENPLLGEAEAEEDDDISKVKKNLSLAFRYRKFVFPTIVIFARTELHAICKQGGGKKLFANLYAFNEVHNSSPRYVEWRPKIDNQRGALIAAELTNNSFKIGKWTAKSLLSGAETMRVGFVSRKTKTDPKNHVVLAVQNFDPQSLATQINLKLKNMWGIFNTIAESVSKQEVGKYVLLKDPNRQSLRLYKLPLDEDVEGNEEVDDEDDVEGEEEGVPMEAEVEQPARRVEEEINSEDDLDQD